MRPCFVIPVSLLLVLAACTSTERSSAPGAEIQAVSQQFQATLDRLWEEAQSTDEVFPGAIAAFMTSTGEVAALSTGYSDVAASEDMRPGMRMPSGSIGKTYVAAVALSMAHDGLIDLDAPISTWVSEEEWFSRLPNGPDLTLRHLLNHSGGLVDHVFDVPEFETALKELVAAGDPDATLTPGQLLEFALDREPLFPAGEGFDYTDTGFILAGMVIEAASGSTYYAELQNRVLDPLEFTHTMRQVDRRVPELAQGYAVVSSGLFGLPDKMVVDGEMVFNPSVEWTGGGVYNNPSDLVRWAKLLYEGEAFDFPYLEELLGSVAVAGYDGPESVYGLGVSVSTGELGRTYGHGGFFPGYNSQMVYFPDRGISVALQINTDGSRGSDHIRTLARVVLEGLGSP